jgi:hypothetical protein
MILKKLLNYISFKIYFDFEKKKFLFIFFSFFFLPFISFIYLNEKSKGGPSGETKIYGISPFFNEIVA